jgi:hypothetical protein
MGPTTQFKSEAGFQQALTICMVHLDKEEWTPDLVSLSIKFTTIKAEEKYSIIVTGLQEWNTTTPFLAS